MPGGNISGGIMSRGDNVLHSSDREALIRVRTAGTKT